MKVILTSSLGGSKKVNGKRIPSTLMEDNGLTDKIKSIWKDNAKVMVICASPNDYDVNNSIYHCLKEAFPMSGLSFTSFEICDDRNEEIVERLDEMDAIILVGGHVPTQNAFMKKIGLREKIESYRGVVIAWSAGSMNCAETVYAGPELEGEAIDPDYQRWISGLGLTKINIFPHFQSLKDEMLDGLRLIEDITYADSMGHEFIALNDGSYIVIEDGVETLYGEAYSIKDGNLKQICKNGESYIFSSYK
ncbi:MAG: Type 1 glutamine amidotransferase-like domain-containing protein [Lachnospiraceae bacterium]|nr:Type 1 glutamine amidotransferase-like domain-containing protein [Lachnospiraceae bacterium]